MRVQSCIFFVALNHIRITITIGSAGARGGGGGVVFNIKRCLFTTLVVARNFL